MAAGRADILWNYRSMALARGVADPAREGGGGGRQKCFFESKLLTLMSYKRKNKGYFLE